MTIKLAVGGGVYSYRPVDNAGNQLMPEVNVQLTFVNASLVNAQPLPDGTGFALRAPKGVSPNSTLMQPSALDENGNNLAGGNIEIVVEAFTEVG